MSSSTLTFAFVTPGPSDHWMNRLTARVSKHPVCHVELFFDTINMCFSIVYGEKCGLRYKSMANPNYRIVALSVSQKEYDTCLDFCRTAKTWDLEFDNTGMWRSYYTPSCCGRSSQHVGHTFCSKIITEALMFAELPEVVHCNPSCMTPSRLYELLTKSDRIVCNTVPYKCQALSARGIP